MSRTGTDSSVIAGNITWDVTFDQDVSNVLGTHFALIASVPNPAGSPFPPVPTTDTNTVIASINANSNNFAISGTGKVRSITVTLPTFGIDEFVQLDLALSSTANEILGTRGPNVPPATGMSTPNLVLPIPPELPPTLTDSSTRYTARSVARWLSIDAGVINASTGTQTFIATFSQPVLGLAESNFNTSLGDSENAFSTSNSVVANGPDSDGYAAKWTIHTTTPTPTTGKSVTLTPDNTTNIQSLDVDAAAHNISSTILATALTQQFIDTTPPQIQSFTRVGADEHTSTGDVSWTVLFTEAVEDVTLGVSNQFEVRRDNSRIVSAITTVSAGSSNREYIVAVSGISVSSPSDSTLTLRTTSSASTIMDLSTNPSSNAFNPSSPHNVSDPTNNPFIDESFDYNTDITPPTASATRVLPSNQRITDKTTVASWQVRFTDDIDTNTLSIADFAVTTDSGVDISAITIALESITATSVRVNANLVSLTSTASEIDLHLNISGVIEDATSNDNELAVARISGSNNYILNTDLVAPTATVAVTNPTNLFTSGGNLTEQVTWTFAFSHEIEGFNDNQFELSPPTPITSLSHARIGTSNQYTIRATFPALQTVRTRTKLVYTGNLIRRVGGNAVPVYPRYI